jgi:Na+/proline symporter
LHLFSDTLSSLGEVAFGAIAQIGPALFVAFYWRKATLAGVIAGISCGFIIWATFNLLPQLGIYNHPLLHRDLPKTTVITLIGLFVNIIALCFVSLLTRQSIREQMQRVKWGLNIRINTLMNDLLLVRWYLKNPKKYNILLKITHKLWFAV